MRLFLSSYRAGDHTSELQRLFGKKIKVAVITNAKDYKSTEEREESVADLSNFLSGLGYKPVEVDLRDYFDKPEDLAKEMQQYQAVWVAGGNTFVLARAMRYSQADKLLYDMVRKNEIIYAGESAGACLASPSLRGVEFGDDLRVVPVGYSSEVIWDGLDFVQYYIVPHYGSAEFSQEPQEMEAYLKKQGLPYKKLTDQQAIVINGDKEEFLK